MTDRYVIRTMSAADLAGALDWAAAEGWNPGVHDAVTFAAADPGGFLVGVLDGEPVASLSVVRYGAGFAFLGLYIVRPAQRGKGYGWRLWQAGMALGRGRTVGLDGVPAQQDNYRKSGFALAWQNVRYAGRGTGLRTRDARIVPCATLPFAALDAYDRPFFPEARTRFLEAWLAQPEATALACADAGRVQGYGVVRRCREGHKIGPLVADTPGIAEALFAALAGTVPPHESVYLDVPAPNVEAGALAQRHAMHESFATARMYTRDAPALPLGRLYGVTTFELG